MKRNEARWIINTYNVTLPLPTGVANEDEDDVAQLIDQLKTTKVTKRRQRQKQEETTAAAAEETSAGASYWDTTQQGHNDGDDENIVPETPLTALERMKRSDDFGEKSWTQSDRDYLYEELLDRIFTTIQKQNPELGTGTRKKFRIKPPQIAREPKKTIFVNFREICEKYVRVCVCVLLLRHPVVVVRSQNILTHTHVSCN